MASFTGILKKLFGSKADRDLKQIKPILDKTLQAYERIDKLSDDQLRAESENIKKIIADRISENEKKKKEYRSQLEDLTLAPEEKERIASDIDKLTKRIDEQIEEVLADVLPDAFAIMKSTARRFKENSEIKVLASDRDRDLSTIADLGSIDGAYAIWKNSWFAGGNMITWDMVHYDVPRIGGIAFH